MANNKNIKVKEPKVNREIRGYSEVRLIYKKRNGETDENDFNKVVDWHEAVRLANSMGLDLIEINANTKPPIIRLDDYSKYLYELKKSLKTRNKNSADLKEVQIKTNISHHDLEIKANKAKKFIEDGDKVKLVLTMKGRELARREDSKKAFYQFADMMLETGIVSFDGPIRDEENKCIVIFKKK